MASLFDPMQARRLHPYPLFRRRPLLRHLLACVFAGGLWTLALPAFIIAAGGAVSNLAANAISGRYGGAPDEAIEWGDDFVDDGAGFYDRNGSVHNAGAENLSLAAARSLGPLS